MQDLVGGSFNKQGTLHMRSSWVAARVVDLHFCLVSLKAYGEALTGFRYVYCSHGLNTTSMS